MPFSGGTAAASQPAAVAARCFARSASSSTWPFLRCKAHGDHLAGAVESGAQFRREDAVGGFLLGNFCVALRDDGRALARPGQIGRQHRDVEGGALLRRVPALDGEHDRRAPLLGLHRLLRRASGAAATGGSAGGAATFTSGTGYDPVNERRRMTAKIRRIVSGFGPCARQVRSRAPRARRRPRSSSSSLSGSFHCRPVRSSLIVRPLSWYASTNLWR